MDRVLIIPRPLHKALNNSSIDGPLCSFNGHPTLNALCAPATCMITCDFVCMLKSIGSLNVWLVSVVHKHVFCWCKLTVLEWKNDFGLDKKHVCSCNNIFTAQNQSLFLLMPRTYKHTEARKQMYKGRLQYLQKLYFYERKLPWWYIKLSVNINSDSINDPGNDKTA